MTSIARIVAEVSACRDVIAAAVQGVTPEQLAADSPLPDWDRAHVVAHIAGFSHGMARQFEYALRGEQIEQYTGGVEGRNADIERWAAAPVEELKAESAAALDHLASAIAAMTDADWDRPISYRQGTAVGGLEAAWREYAIHLADLDLGSTSAQWSEDFCAHLFDFLATRLPADITLSGAGVQIGGGPHEVHVDGARTDLAAWLAGREPIEPLTFSSGAAPELGPWPARKN